MFLIVVLVGIVALVSVASNRTRLQERFWLVFGVVLIAFAALVVVSVAVNGAAT